MYIAHNLMPKSFINKIIGLMAAATSLVALTGAVSASSIYNTGPHSYNKVSYSSYSNYYKKNVNNVSTYNTNFQMAKSGDAKVWGNTFGGSATSGNATNNATNTTWVSIYNH